MPKHNPSTVRSSATHLDEKQDERGLPDQGEDALARLACQDPAAFDELYRRHFTRVYRYHMAHTRSVPDAQDLTAQTFIAALESLPTYRGTGSFAAWLLGIARHKRLLFYRRQRPETSLEGLAELVDSAPGPESAALQRLQLDGILRSLQNLSPERAEAIRLCLFAGLSPEQAGSVMDKSSAAIKMLVSRGLRDLRARSAIGLAEEE